MNGNLSKTRMKRILALAILATMFVGCDQENGTETTPADKSFVPTGVYFNYGDNDTRTSVSVNNGASHFLWNTGDQIGVSCAESGVTNKAAAVEEQYNNQNQATFMTRIEFNDKYTDHIFNLYYPYKASSSTYPVNITSVRHTLAAIQSGVVGKHDFMWDQVKTTKENPTAGGTMKHPFAYIRFYIVDVDGYLGNIGAEEISSLTMDADGTLAGDFTADFNNFAKYQVTFAGSTSNSVTLNAPLKIYSKSEYQNKTIDSQYPVLVINPNGVGDSFDATIQIPGMAPMSTTFNMGTRKFEANNFYNIGLGGSFDFGGKFTLSVIDWERVTLDVTFN